MSIHTIIRKINKEHPDPEVIREAGGILRAGGLVAFPTETVYGLGADALNEEAAKKIYAAKGRPSDNPLIIHITNMKDLERIVTEIPETAKMVAEEHPPTILSLSENSQLYIILFRKTNWNRKPVSFQSRLLSAKTCLSGRRKQKVHHL